MCDLHTSELCKELPAISTILQHRFCVVTGQVCHSAGGASPAECTTDASSFLLYLHKRVLLRAMQGCRLQDTSSVWEGLMPHPSVQVKAHLLFALR